MSLTTDNSHNRSNSALLAAAFVLAMLPLNKSWSMGWFEKRKAARAEAQAKSEQAALVCQEILSPEALEQYLSIERLKGSILVSPNGNPVIILDESLTQHKKLDKKQLAHFLSSEEFQIAGYESQNNAGLWGASGERLQLNFRVFKRKWFDRIITLGLSRQKRHSVVDSLAQQNQAAIDLEKGWSPSVAAQVGYSIEQARGWLGMAGFGIMILGLADHLVALPSFGINALETYQASGEVLELSRWSEATPLGQLGVYDPIKSALDYLKQNVFGYVRDYKLAAAMTVATIRIYQKRLAQFKKYIPTVALREDKSRYIAERILSFTEEYPNMPILLVIEARNAGVVRTILQTEYDFQIASRSDLKKEPQTKNETDPHAT